MHRWYDPMKVCAAFVVVLLMLTPGYPVHADGPSSPSAIHGAGPIKIQVQDGGFNDKPELVVEVEQGELVELTFQWAHQGYPNEEHIMVLEGYKLETDKLARENKEATLKFVADKVGTFNFKCDLDCDIHDSLQGGYLKVKSGGGVGKVTLTPTNLVLTPSSLVTGGDPVSIMATLRDAQGAPVSKAELEFFVDAAFAGTESKMLLGKAKTDANGVAFLDYHPTLGVEQHKITAVFEGMGLFAESQQNLDILEVGTPPAAFNPEPIGLEGIRRWAPTGLGLVMLTVWSLLAFVLFQGVGVAWSRPRK